MVEKSCLICELKFSVYPSIAKTKKYCSRVCMGKAGKGRKRSEATKKAISNSLKEAHKNNPGPWRKDYSVTEETRIKMSESASGRKLSDDWIKNRTRAQTGLKRSEETRRKMSAARMGKNAPGWKGGVSKKNRTDRANFMVTFEYKEWRKKIFKRDDYTCQICGEKGGELNADHIKPYQTHPKLRLCLDNGRTLCVKCHRKTPTYGGSCKKVL